MEGRESLSLPPFEVVFNAEVAKIQDRHLAGPLERFLTDFLLLLVGLFVHDVVRKGYLVKMLCQSFCAFLSLQFCLVLDVFAVDDLFVVENHLFEGGVVRLSRVFLCEGVSFLLLPFDFQLLVELVEFFINAGATFLEQLWHKLEIFLHPPGKDHNRQDKTLAILVQHLDEQIFHLDLLRFGGGQQQAVDQAVSQSLDVVLKLLLFRVVLTRRLR